MKSVLLYACETWNINIQWPESILTKNCGTPWITPDKDMRVKMDQTLRKPTGWDNARLEPSKDLELRMYQNYLEEDYWEMSLKERKTRSGVTRLVIYRNKWKFYAPEEVTETDDECLLNQTWIEVKHEHSGKTKIQLKWQRDFFGLY